MTEPEKISLKEFIEIKFEDQDKRLDDKFAVVDRRFATLDQKLTLIDRKFSEEHDKVLSAERDISDVSDEIKNLDKRVTDCQQVSLRRKVDVDALFSSKIKELKSSGMLSISWKALGVAGTIILLLLSGLIYSYKTFFMVPVLDHINALPEIQQMKEKK